MERLDFHLHVEEDWPGADGLRYISPTETGPAYNGKDTFTLEEAAANLNRTGAIWKVGPNGQRFRREVLRLRSLSGSRPPQRVS